MRLLCDGFRWFGTAAAEARRRHDVVALDAAAIEAAWQAPQPDWWRAHVPDGWVPDVALFTCPEYHRAPPLLEALPCPVALWVGDWYADPQALSWIADQVDLLLADATGVAALRRLGIAHVDECCPWTFHPALHEPDWDAAPERDVGFLGSLNDAIQHERNRWLARLAGLPSDVVVEIRDDRYGVEQVRFLQRSRLCFNFSLTGDVNMRCFEAAACGSVVLIDAGSVAQVARWFEPGREVVVYGEDDLEVVVRELLADEPRRRAIARAAHARVQAHAPEPRLDALLERLEALAAAGRRPGRDQGGPAAGARWGAYGLSVETAPPAVIAGIERLLDAAEQAAPADGAIQVHRGRLYAALAAAGGPQAADALGWAGEHLERALDLDPGDAVARLAQAQLHRRAGDGDSARALATALAADIERGATIAQPDRVALDEPLGERIARQSDFLAAGDPSPALTRRAAVAALRLAAETSPDDPAARAALLDRALVLADGAASVRLELGMALLGVDPRAVLPHSTQLLAERPLNGAVWLLHAYALALSGQAPAAQAFVAACGAMAERVRVDDGLIDRLRAAIS